MVSVKFQYCNSVRRVDVELKKRSSPSTAPVVTVPRLKQLHKVARSLFQNNDVPNVPPLPEEIILKYVDEEGDLIVVTCDSEVEEAFRCMNEKCKKIPKFHIHNKNKEPNATQIAVNVANQALHTINTKATQIQQQLQHHIEKIPGTVKVAVDRVSDETKRLANGLEKTVRTTVDKIKIPRRNPAITSCVDPESVPEEEQQQTGEDGQTKETEPVLDDEERAVEDEEEQPLLEKEEQSAYLLEQSTDDVIDDPVELQLRQLDDMGFTNSQKNRTLLVKYKGDIVATIRELLDNLS